MSSIQRKIFTNLCRFLLNNSEEPGIPDIESIRRAYLYSRSGINATSNAFLFRADIHDLFDSNLIGIKPKTLEVVPDKILNNTEYGALKGAKIFERIDGKKPDFNALNYRWDIFNSLANK